MRPPGGSEADSPLGENETEWGLDLDPCCEHAVRQAVGRIEVDPVAEAAASSAPRLAKSSCMAKCQRSTGARAARVASARTPRVGKSKRRSRAQHRRPTPRTCPLVGCGSGAPAARVQGLVPLVAGYRARQRSWILRQHCIIAFTIFAIGFLSAEEATAWAAGAPAVLGSCKPHVLRSCAGRTSGAWHPQSCYYERIALAERR